MKPRTRTPLLLVYVLLALPALAACAALAGTQAAEGDPALTTLESEGTAEEQDSDSSHAALPGSTPDPPAQDVLAACPVQGQAAAMRPGSEPDWEALDLSACYELELDLSGVPEYTGGLRLTFTNLTGVELPDLVFRLYPNADRIYGGDLQVSSASVDGVSVQPEVFLPDQTGLRLPLAEPLQPGEVTVVELEFSGRVPVDRNGQGGVYGTFNFDSSAEVLVLANGFPLLAVWEAGGWRADPVIGIGDAVVSRVAVYQVKVAAPSGWQVIATGVKASSGEGSSAEFVSGPVREFMLVASPNFVEREARVNGVQVRHWGLPGGEELWESGLEAAVDSLSLFDERFGPYPYLELDVVAVPLWLAAGVEYPGLILLRQALYLDGPARSGNLEFVVAHEVAHQWWYGVVGNDVLQHPWQDEGLTSYSTLLYLEEYQPQAYTARLRNYQEGVSQLESTGSDTGVGQPLQAFQERPGDYSLVVYVKGALFFDALQQRLRDGTFFQALRAYYAQNQFGLAPPQALLDSFEEACSCSLDSIYQEWGVE